MSAVAKENLFAVAYCKIAEIVEKRQNIHIVDVSYRAALSTYRPRRAFRALVEGKERLKKRKSSTLTRADLFGVSALFAISSDKY